MTAFRQAEAAIAHARRPNVVAGEGATRKRGPLELPAYRGLLDRLYIPVERLKLHSNAFEELERAAVNVEVHFGIDVAHQLRESLRARHGIVVATARRMGSVALPGETKVSRALVRQWEAVAHAGTVEPDDVDQLSVDMDEAKWAVETALWPLVEAPTFSEFLLVHELRSAVRRALHWARPGYGKIAIYAAVPLAERTLTTPSHALTHAARHCERPWHSIDRRRMPALHTAWSPHR